MMNVSCVQLCFVGFGWHRRQAGEFCWFETMDRVDGGRVRPRPDIRSKNSAPKICYYYYQISFSKYCLKIYLVDISLCAVVVIWAFSESIWYHFLKHISGYHLWDIIVSESIWYLFFKHISGYHLWDIIVFHFSTYLEIWSSNSASYYIVFSRFRFGIEVLWLNI